MIKHKFNFLEKAVAKMKRKRFLILCVFLSLSLLLGACQSGQQENVLDKQINSSSSSSQVQEQSNTDDTQSDADISSDTTSDDQNDENSESEEEDTAMKINVQINDYTFTATLNDNEAANAFFEMIKTEPVTIKMSDYGGFEKVGSLGVTLPSSDMQTTTDIGDIVLYQSNQIVIFYGSNSWSYTRLGRIDDVDGLRKAITGSAVDVTFSAEE